MKAIAVAPAERAVRLVDAPEPRLESPRDVKVRMLEAGICGTDKEIARFEYGDPPPGERELIIGHESLGEVVEVGPEVTAFRPGDLAVFMVRRPCERPDCKACRSGRQDFCYTGEFTERGIKQRHGFLAEYAADDERYLVPIPRDLRDVAVLVEPLTIAEKAYFQVLDVQDRLPWLTIPQTGEPPLKDRKALVLGAGPVGLLGAMKLMLEGAETSVYSREPASAPKAQLAEKLGARYISSEDVPTGKLAEATGGIDLVYEATGAAKLSFDVLCELASNGIFVFTGVPGRKSPVELEAGTLMKRMVLENQLILGTVNAGRDAFQAAVRDLARFRERFGDLLPGLITARHPLEGFLDLDLEHLSGVKTVIDIARA